ncbi:universal stress protein [Algoriphagus litoralis]|uniref:universal stress protein n=1 Tax=Algoriphagus litoralis TaxID=2202829 RepID=UPI000DB9492B|nr:universal stress protein [Algoriphagus litoralis]
MFQKIALAIAFSPRMEALIAEAKKLISQFKSELILIHVGIKTPELEAKLSEIIVQHGLDTEAVTTIWTDGKPAKMILKACEQENVDLLMLGALKSEGFMTYYLGSVARKVIRKASCSVLTLIEPSVETSNYDKVVINGTQLDITPEVIRQGLEFCKTLEAKQISILNEIKMYGLLMGTASEGTEDEASITRRKLVQDEITYVEDILKEIDKEGLKINIKVTGGKWAAELAKYCEKINADLLIVGDDRSLTFFDRIFPHDLEELLSTLPCNLLIIKK